MSCLSMESRDIQHDAEMDKLVERGVLTTEETAILMETPSHATALWCWMSAVGAEILEMMTVPAPNHNMFYQEIRQGLMGIHTVI